MVKGTDSLGGRDALLFSTQVSSNLWWAEGHPTSVKLSWTRPVIDAPQWCVVTQAGTQREKQGRKGSSNTTRHCSSVGEAPARTLGHPQPLYLSHWLLVSGVAGWVLRFLRWGPLVRIWASPEPSSYMTGGSWACLTQDNGHLTPAGDVTPIQSYSNEPRCWGFVFLKSGFYSIGGTRKNSPVVCRVRNRGHWTARKGKRRRAGRWQPGGRSRGPAPASCRGRAGGHTARLPGAGPGSGWGTGCARQVRNVRLWGARCSPSSSSWFPGGNERLTERKPRRWRPRLMTEKSRVACERAIWGRKESYMMQGNCYEEEGLNARGTCCVTQFCCAKPNPKMQL